MDGNDLVLGALFTKDGKDIWKLKSYCLTPTCELVNLETGEIEGFGLGGITAESFDRVVLNKAKK